jgi:hypothetical protein
MGEASRRGGRDGDDALTPPPSIVARVMALAWIRNPLWRRLVCGGLALVLALLCLFPRHYVAHVKLAPDDTGGDLGGAAMPLGGAVGAGSLLGASPVEFYLHIARGHDVLDDVVGRLGLAAPGDPTALRRAELGLLGVLDIESIRGGVIDIQARAPNPALARRIVAAYAAAIRDRIDGLAAAQSARKRAVLIERLNAAHAGLIAAQAALDQFRRDHRLNAPAIQLGSVARLADLEGRLQAKTVELQTAAEFSAGDREQIRQVRSQIDDLRRAVSQVEASSADVTAGSAPADQLEYEDRFRALQYSLSLYDIYQRYLEAAQIDGPTQLGGLQVIDQPYVDPRAQFNLSAVGALLLLLALAGCAEVYLRDAPRSMKP